MQGKNPLRPVRNSEMVLPAATADAIREARRSAECAARECRQKGGLVTPLETEQVPLSRISDLHVSRRRLRLVSLLAGIGWLLALACAARLLGVL